MNDNAILARAAGDTATTPPPKARSAQSKAGVPTLVALTGRAGSGKSTAADYLVEEHGFVLVKFAEPLKNMLRALGLSDEEIEGSLKEQRCSLLAGRTPRHAMQTLGTEWGRDCIGADFWIGLWERIACDVLDHGGRVVVDDCRFPNEAGAVRRAGGRVVGLTGRGGIAGAHASEAGVEPDLWIANGGSVEALCREIDDLFVGMRQ